MRVLFKLHFFSRQTLYSFILFSMALFFMAGSVLAIPDQVMKVGESRVITLKQDISKVATGEPNICDVTKVSAKEILLNAKSPGTVSIIIWDISNQKYQFQVKVIPRDLQAYKRDIERVLGDIEGIKIYALNDKVVVDGELFSEKDLDRVNRTLKNAPQVLNLTRLSPKVFYAMGKEIVRTIGLKGITTRISREKIFVEGVVYNKADYDRINSIIKTYGDRVVNLVELRKPGMAKPRGTPRMIQMTMNIVELDRKGLDLFSFHWAPGIGANAGGTYSARTGEKPSLTGFITGTISSLFPKIRSAEESGMARNLHQQTLICKEGEKAKFHVGGEIAIPVMQQGGGTTIEYKDYGLTLSFKPIIDAKMNIDTQIDIESSMPIASNTGIPSFKKSTLSTRIITEAGQSIVLGGLISQRESEVFGALPEGAEGDGFLFELSKSKEFRKNRSEVLIFVTPKILSSAKEGGKEIRNTIEGHFKDYEDEKKIFDKYSPSRPSSAVEKSEEEN